MNCQNGLTINSIYVVGYVYFNRILLFS